MKHCWQTINNDDGFSLMDVLISVVLLGVGVLSFASFTGGIMDRNTASEMTTIAVGLAEERVEALKLKSQNATIGDSDDGTLVKTVLNIPYSILTDVQNGGVGNLVDITVTVTWTDNLPSSYTLSTRIHQN
jgi:Tfp pilus assembly protein PilV